MVWQTEQGAQCPGCGLPTWATLDPENDGVYTAHKVTCHACAAIERRQAVAERTPGSMVYASKD